VTDSVKQPNTRTREINLTAEVIKAWGPEYAQREVCYVWSNGRQFLNTDRDGNGIYSND